MSPIRYTPALDKAIHNTDALPKGTGAKYLLCIHSHKPGEYIAKAWKRKPVQTKGNEVIIQFG